MRLRVVLQCVLAFMAGTALAWGVSSCGGADGSGTGTVAANAKNAISSATGEAKRDTTPARTRETSAPTERESSPPKADSSPPKEDSTPPRTVTETRTVTATQPAPPPPKPKTKTKTVTAPAPPPGTTVSNETTVHATTEESGGIPWWGWLLIALGVAAIAIGTYLVGRRRRRGDGTGNDAGTQPPSDPL